MPKGDGKGWAKSKVPIMDRFWSCVVKDEVTGCWLWQRYLVKGYGQFSVTRGERVYAHRFAWELLRGPIPDGLTIDHLCKVTACCNPSHLEPVTQAENTRRSWDESGIDPSRALCPNGHPWVGGDLYATPAGDRQCRACRREADARYRERRRGADTPLRPRGARRRATE